MEKKKLTTHAGEILRNKMQEVGMRPIDLARQMGTTPQLVNHYLGKSDMLVSNFTKIQTEISKFASKKP